MRVHVLLTAEGTACSETALCAEHFTPERRKQFEFEARYTSADIRPNVAGGWHEVDNDACLCVECPEVANNGVSFQRDPASGRMRKLEG